MVSFAHSRRKTSHARARASRSPTRAGRDGIHLVPAIDADPARRATNEPRARLSRASRDDEAKNGFLDAPSALDAEPNPRAPEERESPPPPAR